MQSRFFAKKRHQNDHPGLHLGGLWGSLWSTLGTKWHPRGIFLRGQYFDAKKGNRVILRRLGRGRGGPYKQVAKLEAWRPGPSLQAYEASKLP